MGKRFILALWALCFASAALAQSFPKPPDVASFSQVAPVYNTSGTANTTLDPAVTPMPIGSGLTNIPIPSNTNRIATVGPYNGTADPFILTTTHGGTGTEAKFRTQADFSHMLPDDPIRNYGQPGSSHLHCFFGGGSTNAYSTYSTLRKHGLTSFAAGSDANATGYWHPCLEVLNPYGNGKNYALKDDFVTIYYSNGPAVGEGSAFIPTGLRYVFGFDMDAASPSFGNGGQYAWLQAYLDAANTTIGHTRYQLTNPGTGLMATSPRWICPGGTPVTAANTNVEANSSKYLAMGDGSDPFGGTCVPASVTASISATTLNVTAITGGSVQVGSIITGTGIATGTHVTANGTGSGGIGTYTIDITQTVASEAMTASNFLYLRIDGAECYDGTNLWSPGGYKHFIPPIWDADFSAMVCPTNYYHLPKLTLEIDFNQTGFSDYGRWVLSSDLSYRAAHSLTATQVPNGSTFHTDWDDGWDQAVRRIWETNCIGAMHNTSHTCNSSVISSTQQLMGASNTPGVVRNPVVDTTLLPHVLETDSGWMLIPPAWSGGMSGMKIHQ